MTDKFVVSTNEIGEIIVTDAETGNVCRYGDISRFFGLIRLLNELNDENTELKKENDNCKNDYRELFSNYISLEEENKELEKVNEDLREVNKENQLLHEENVKQCERWKNLYEIKDAEVTARVDALNRVCEYYTSEVLFKSDVDPNKAVKEVINEILNTEVEM